MKRIDETIAQYLNEADDITKLWKKYSEAMSSADYYENAGERKGVGVKKYYAAAEKAKSEVEKSFGKDAANDLKKFGDLMADIWYGQGGSTPPAAKKLLSKYKIEWDGDLS